MNTERVTGEELLAALAISKKLGGPVVLSRYVINHDHTMMFASYRIDKKVGLFLSREGVQAMNAKPNHFYDYEVTVEGVKFTETCGSGSWIVPQMNDSGAIPANGFALDRALDEEVCTRVSFDFVNLLDIAKAAKKTEGVIIKVNQSGLLSFTTRNTAITALTYGKVLGESFRVILPSAELTKLLSLADKKTDPSGYNATLRGCTDHPLEISISIKGVQCHALIAPIFGGGEDTDA